MEKAAKLKIEVLRISGDDIHLEGLISAYITGMPYSLKVKNGEGSGRDAIIEGGSFSIDMQIYDGCRLRFVLVIGNDEIGLSPGFGKHTGINKKERSNYIVNNGYIVKARGKELIVSKDTAFERFKSELRLRKAHKSDKEWKNDRKIRLKIMKAVNDQKLSDKIAFVSVRSDGEPKDNLGTVYSQMENPKVCYCSRTISKEPNDRLKAAECVYSSKVVVTDDYLPVFRDYGKRKGQYFIQIWHAAGAFKKFGADSTTQPLCLDALYHRDYDLVTVSSEHVREIYAKAFAIDVEKVKALGLPRSDRFCNKDYLERTKEKVYEKMPNLKDKQIILYAPSFRGKGKNRIYLPEVDYTKINDSLGEDQIIVFCPHPLTPTTATIGDFDKIIMVRGLSTNEMMIAADLLITDYSSVIFEYSLLDKPMAFFCYDYETYDRDFYLDYDTDLPGTVFKDAEELIEYLQKGVFETDGKLTAFREKYMSACDGHSTERVVKAIEEFMDK